MERLQKFLSRAGVASRRAAEGLILDGQVKVNGVVVTEMGSRVDPDKDLVVVAGQPVTVSPQRQYFLLYKPPGVVTTLSDPQGRATVADFIQKLPGRVYPVGRLDFDAEGALLLTDDGELANQLMHPSHQVPRIYLAKVKGEPEQASLDKLLSGVRLEDGLARAVEVRRFEVAERNTWLKLVVTEGRQHLVKRLCAAIGHPVVRLFRPAHAGVSVQGLRPGQVRPVSEHELKQIRALVAGGPSPDLELFLPGRRHGHGFSTGLGGEPEEEVPEARPPRGAQGGGAAPVDAGEDEVPQERREYFSKRGPDPVERTEKPAAVGRGRPPRTADDRGGPPRKAPVPRLERSRFAPPAVEAAGETPAAVDDGESAIEAPRPREPGAFGRGKRPGAPDGRLGKPSGKPRYGTAGPRRDGPRREGPGGRPGKPPGRFSPGGPRRAGGAGPRREGAGSDRFARPPSGARFGAPRGEGEGGAPGGRPERPAARSVGPRREGAGGRFEKPAGRFGGPRREGAGGAEGGRFGKPAGFGGPRREGAGGAEGGRFGKPAGGARFGGPRREGAGGAEGGRFGKPAGGARFGGPRREGGGSAEGGRFGKPAGGARFGGPRREGAVGAEGGRFGKPAGGARSGGPRRAGAGGPSGGRFGKPPGGGRFGASSGPRRSGPGGPRSGPPRGGPRKPGGFSGGRPAAKRPGPRR